MYVICEASSIFADTLKLSQVQILNDLEQAEVSLRLSAVGVSNLRGEPSPSSTKKIDTKTAYYLNQMREILDRANFENSTLAAYRVIVLDALHEDLSNALETLEKSDGENGIALARDLRLAFLSSAKSTHSTAMISPSSRSEKDIADTISTDIRKRLPESWFRSFALDSLYRNTHQTDQLASLKTHQMVRNDFLVKGIIVLGLLSVLSVLAGAVIVLVELIRRWRKRSLAEPAQSTFFVDGVRFDAKAVYGTVVAFVGTKLTLRQIFGFSWFYNPQIDPENALKTSIALGLIYALVNGIALFYAYIFMMRPNHVRFLDGISLRLRVGDIGPVQMLVIGVLTFCATMTLTGLSNGLSMLVGLSGSSNPITTVESQIARSGDIGAIINLFGQFLVLVPFIEEGFVRGFLYTALRQRMSAFRSIIISALFFAALHFDLGGFISLFSTGVVFAYVVERTRSTLPTMFAHGLSLSIMFIASLLFAQ